MWDDNPNIQRQGFVIKSAGTLLFLWMKKKAYHFLGPKKIPSTFFLKVESVWDFTMIMLQKWKNSAIVNMGMVVA